LGKECYGLSDHCQGFFLKVVAIKLHLKKQTLKTHHHLLHGHQHHIATSILQLLFYQILINEKKNQLF